MWVQIDADFVLTRLCGHRASTNYELPEDDTIVSKHVEIV